MNVDFERQDGSLIASVHGSVDGTNAAEFQATLQGAVQDEDKGMLLDFGKLEYISSAGLRVLLLIAKEMQRKSSSFAVCSLSGQVRELFTVSGFDQIIAIHNNKKDALKSFK